MIGPLTFAHPVALIALAAAPLLVVAAGYEARRRNEADARYGGPAALRRGRGQGRTAVRAVLLPIVVALLAIALAGPRWGAALVPIERRGIDVAIVLDVSRSMTATDVSPSRAGAAADGLRDLLSHLTGNRVGLVTFAGTAFARSPLSLDLGAVSSLVARAQGDAPLVVGGTDLQAAIDNALSLLHVPDPARTQAIVLVSDGEDLGSDVPGAVRRARDRHIPIYTVFVGTTVPTALPESSGGTERSVGDPGALDRIAQATGATTRNLSAIAGLAVEFRRLDQTRFDSAVQLVPVERFPWFVAAALALLALHTLIPASTETSVLPRRRGRRDIAGLGGVALLLLVGCGGTATYRHVQAANQQYAAGHFDRALVEYQAAAALSPDDPAISYDLANTQYQLGHLEDAATAAERALQGSAHDALLRVRAQYIAGNIAARAGELEQARDAYEATLRLDPTDHDAKQNLELVLRMIEPPPVTPPPDSDQSPPQDDGRPNAPVPGDQPGTVPTPKPGEADHGQPLPGPGTASGGAGSNPDATGGSVTAEQAQAALQQALDALGPEITVEQARQILSLARQANDLQRLPPRGGGGVPPR